MPSLEGEEKGGNSQGRRGRKPEAERRVLTAAFVRHAGPGEYFDKATKGLGLRVSPHGRRSFFLRYRTRGGKNRRLSLGACPPLTLAEARRKARVLIAEVAQGGDPALEVEARRKRPLTFGEAAEEALRLLARRTRPKTIQERQRIVDTYLLPVWRDRPLEEIRRGDVVAVTARIQERAPTMGNRVLSLVRALFNVFLDLEWVEANPAARPGRFMAPEAPKGRVLTDGELQRVLAALGAEVPRARAFLLLVAYTAQRAGAVAAARWEEWDFEAKLWRIPPEPGRKFRGWPRLVPLTEGALRALAELEAYGRSSEYLFPTRPGSRRAHFEGWNTLARRLRARSGTAGWSLHSFRATFRTWGSRQGFMGEVLDAVLGHVTPTVGVVHYEGDKPSYLLAEKRQALEAWGAHLDGLSAQP